MENQWYGRYTFEQVEKIREAAKEDNSVAFDIQSAAGNDARLTRAIIDGPTDEQLEALKAAGEGDQIHSDFNDVWGVGAAEYYASYEPTTVWDHISEIPGAAARGVAGAVAELNELMYNSRTLDPEVATHMAANLENELRALDGRPELTDEERHEIYKQMPQKVDWDADTILRNMIEKPETVTGNLTEGFIQFAAPFLTGVGGVSKLGLLANAGPKGQIAAATAVGFVTDYAFFDEDDPLMVTALADYFEIESSIVDDYFRHQPGDTDAEKRFRRAVEGAGVGVVLDTFMLGIASVARRVRTKQITPDLAADEVRALMDDLDAENLVPDQAVDEAIAEAGELPWHLKPDVEAEAAAPRAADEALEEEAEAVTEEAVEVMPDSTIPRLQATLEQATGQPQGKPNVTAAEHKRAIAKARRLYEATRQVDMRAAWEAATEALRRGTDTLAEAGVRTKEAIAQAVMRPYERVMRMVDAGDVDGLRSFAGSEVTIAEFRLRSEAIQLAARAVRAQTDKMAQMYDAAMSNGKLTMHESVTLREMLHQQIQFAMELEAINTNMGSAAGALLGQRAGHMSVVDELTAAVKEAEAAAKAAGKSAKETRKAARDASKAKEKEILGRLKSEQQGGNAGWLAGRYRELTKMGVDPLTAYKRVREMGRNAERNNVLLNPKTRTDLQEAKHKARLAEETTGDKVLRGLEQWRYNAMLSGLKTHETNFLSSFANMTSRLAYEAVFGNKEMRIAASRKVVGMIQGFKQSASYALEAYKQMKPVLDQLSAFERLDPVYKNHILTYPTRLMLATDQFIKQLTYRGEIYASAAADADLAKLTGAQRDEFIQSRIDKSFDAETGAGLDSLAIERAQSVTFQKEFDANSKYLGERAMASATRALSDTYWGRFMFPFMRIFFRLTDEGVRMTPGLREGIALGSKLVNGFNGKPGSSKYWDDLIGHNGKTAQARAAGEYAVGLGLVGWTIGMVAEGKITGGEERNYVDAMMRRKVVPPYSIQIGDKWYSYERFEPFAFPMKFFANTLLKLRQVQDADERGEYEKDSELTSAHIGVMAYVFGEALTNNSFMEGIESIVKMTSGSFEGDATWKRPVHTMADSFVPNILRKVNQSMDESGNKYRADPLTWDAFKRHFSSVLDMEDVDLQRNQFTGEVYDYSEDSVFEGHTNFVARPIQRDAAMELLIEANEETGTQLFLKRPGAFIKNTDLRHEKAADNDRSLYDKYLSLVSTVTTPKGLPEFQGKTYRQALEELAEDPKFNALPWGNSTRAPGRKVERLREVKNAYEKAALAELSNDKSFAFLMGQQAMHERTQARREESAALMFFRD